MNNSKMIWCLCLLGLGACGTVDNPYATQGGDDSETGSEEYGDGDGDSDSDSGGEGDGDGDGDSGGEGDGDGDSGEGESSGEGDGDGDSGDDDSGDGDGGGAPEQPVLQWSQSQVKQLDFSWDGGSGATHYRLQRSEPGELSFFDVGGLGDIMGESTSVTVPLHLSVGAQYLVSACNASGCTDSPPVDVAGSLEQAVGYVKASSPDAGDRFGHAIALSGDGRTLAVGAPFEDGSFRGIDNDSDPANLDNDLPDSGAVYVFTLSDMGWVQQAYIKTNNDDDPQQSGDEFGISVALSDDGDTLVVGSWKDDSNGVNGSQNNDSAMNSGAVYVFTRSDDEWMSGAYIKAGNVGAYDRFGAQVDISGDGNTLAVTAMQEKSDAVGVFHGGDDGGYNDNATKAGAAYVFSRVGNSWSQQAYIKGSIAPRSNDMFGSAMALSNDGDTLVVGVQNERNNKPGIVNDSGSNNVNINPQYNQYKNYGAAFVFVRQDDTWSEQAYIKPSSVINGQDMFGSSVAVSADGDTLVVTAAGEDSDAIGIDGSPANNLRDDSGAAYVFTRTGGVWAQEAFIKSSEPGDNDGFGRSAALSHDGTMLVIGANREDSSAPGVDGSKADLSTNTGAVYVFEYDGSAWRERSYVKASNPDQLSPNPDAANTAGDQFGWSVALSGLGDTLLVSAHQEASSAQEVGGDDTDNSLANAGAVYLY